MPNNDYTTSFTVSQTPEEVFNSVNNVRGWWSEQIDGPTTGLNSEFSYHYKDVHRCKMKIIESVPGKKIVWLVLENYFDFIQDKTEWRDTRISFEITKEGSRTRLTFTHFGLVPAYECYEICSDAWGNYINGSLKSLIEAGKGNPNPYIPAIDNAETMKGINKDNYTSAFLTDKSPGQAFKAVNNVKGWWTEAVNGPTEKLNDEFTVQFWDIHYSKQRLIEVVPNERVVWLITGSKLTFIKNQEEWTGTRIIFEITPVGNKTEVRMTQVGLVPAIECYKDCSNAWDGYMKSLESLINTGTGKPTTLKELAVPL